MTSKSSSTIKADDPEEDDDPVVKMIKKTGCIDYHYTVQECMVEKRDWRQCQSEVQKFRQCMVDNTRLANANTN